MAQRNALGKGVNFIPHHLASVWKQAKYVQTYQHQNLFIHNTGAIAIQGIPLDAVEEDTQMGPTIQQHLLTHTDILSVEKSDMPNAGKWWILTPKSKLDEIYTFLNEDFHQYMLNSALDQNYLPRCDIPFRNKEQTANTAQ